jgi:hypothetical protein
MTANPIKDATDRGITELGTDLAATGDLAEKDLENGIGRSAGPNYGLIFALAEESGVRAGCRASMAPPVLAKA